MTTGDAILQALRPQANGEYPKLSSSELAAGLGVSPATVKRRLEQLLKDGLIAREGTARATRYRLSSPASMPLALDSTMARTPQSQALLRYLRQPLAMREVAGYRRTFVDDYLPNQSTLLPAALAQDLAEGGRMRGQQPAGTYARKVLEPLLIDLSWSSSRLEGNRYSLLATEELFRSGMDGGDVDAVMLLNHKAAIEFLVDAVPEYGLTPALIRNLHAVLMQDLLADAGSLGRIRQKVVNISDTTFQPTQVPSVLEEMFGQIVEKARQVKNPVESAFFLWVNLAYLQAFEDGNKRLSRLSANIPLMLYNCAPLSFLDIETGDYATAMMGVYEQCNVALAADLFEWAYRRSIKKYAVTLEAMGIPDPVRLHFREALNEAIGQVVRDGLTSAAAIAASALSESGAATLHRLLMDELRLLDVHNCARYRLTMGQVRRWLEAGRPQ